MFKLLFSFRATHPWRPACEPDPESPLPASPLACPTPPHLCARTPPQKAWRRYRSSRPDGGGTSEAAERLADLERELDHQLDLQVGWWLGVGWAVGLVWSP